MTFADPPREGAREAVAGLAAAGLRVKMITGDHPTTAAAIAERVGIHATQVVTGADLERLDGPARAALAYQADIFARVSPDQKVDIVEALQAGGHVVAMTGDGANDAAAIRLADVGVGVASRGSSAARRAADLVLTSADLDRLLDAVAEGRATWGRLRDSVGILLGGNAGEVVFSLVGTAVTGQAPVNTRQLLLVNLLTDMFPALAIALGSGTPDAPPAAGGDRDGGSREIPGPEAAALDPLLRAIAVRGATTAAGALGAWGIGRLTGGAARSSTMGLAALVGTQLGQTALVGRRSPLVLGTAAGSGLVLATIVQTPVLSQFFGCRPLGPVAWGTVLASSTAATVGSVALPRVARAHPEVVERLTSRARGWIPRGWVPLS